MFERKDIRTHHDAINALIAKYCEENGLAFDPKSITYTANEINYKCTIRATDEAGNVALDPWDKMEIDSLIEDAPADVKNAPTVIGRSVHLLNGKVAKILGYNRKRPKYCWRIEYDGGKVVLVPNTMIMWHKGFAA
jgi:hypothetical protein